MHSVMQCVKCVIWDAEEEHSPLAKNAKVNAVLWVTNRRAGSGCAVFWKATRAISRQNRRNLWKFRANPLTQNYFIFQRKHCTAMFRLPHLTWNWKLEWALHSHWQWKHHEAISVCCLCVWAEALLYHLHLLKYSPLWTQFDHNRFWLSQSDDKQLFECFSLQNSPRFPALFTDACLAAHLSHCFYPNTGQISLKLLPLSKSFRYFLFSILIQTQNLEWLCCVFYTHQRAWSCSRHEQKSLHLDFPFSPHLSVVL